jgi:hypothetical protein
MNHQSFTAVILAFYYVFVEVNFENLKPFDLFVPVKTMNRISNIGAHHHHHVECMRGETMF